MKKLVLKDGVYITVGRIEGWYIYIKGNKVLTVNSYTISIESRDNFETWFPLNETTFVSASYNDLYSAYRKVLSQSDTILGTKGALIKPDDIENRIGVDMFERLYLK